MISLTYNGLEQDGKTVTQGGYSTQIVTDEAYTLRVSDKLPLAGVAPLLCAGITTYSPLRHWKVGPGSKVGVVGLGGLGHMALKFATSFGAEVTLFSTSESKRRDAEKLGANHFVITSNPDNFKPLANKLDFIIDTVAGPARLLGLPQHAQPRRHDVLRRHPDRADHRARLQPARPAPQPFELRRRRHGRDAGDARLLRG